MSVVDDLRAVRELLADEKRWTQHAFARDQHGTRVYPGALVAVCWCLEGALLRVDADGAWDLLEDEAGELFLFNDDPSTTHADVLAAIDRAIERANHGTEGDGA